MNAHLKTFAIAVAAATVGAFVAIKLNERLAKAKVAPLVPKS